MFVDVFVCRNVAPRLEGDRVVSSCREPVNANDGVGVALQNRGDWQRECIVVRVRFGRIRRVSHVHEDLVVALVVVHAIGTCKTGE